MILGLANGCFDGLHEGHRYFLGECLAGCDKLMVLVNGDWWIRMNKGGERPRCSQVVRARAVRSLVRPWDEVHLWDGSDLQKITDLHIPDKVFRGWDQKADVENVEIKWIDRFSDVSTTGEIEKGRA